MVYAVADDDVSTMLAGHGEFHTMAIKSIVKKSTDQTTSTDQQAEPN